MKAEEGTRKSRFGFYLHSQFRKIVSLTLNRVGLLFVLELLRENKRMLDKSIREIERERLGLQNQKKLIVEIKKNAKQAQMVSFYFIWLS